MLIIGIDPGLTGAIAGIDWDLVPRIREIVDMPTRKRRKGQTADAKGIMAALERIRNTDEQLQVVVEAAQAFPGQGASHGFNYGWTNGVIDGTLQLWGYPKVFIGPAEWKRRVGIQPAPGATATQKKKLAMDHARDLFGDRQADQWFPAKGHDGRAEAALMAYAFGLQRTSAS